MELVLGAWRVRVATTTSIVLVAFIVTRQPHLKFAKRWLESKGTVKKTSNVVQGYFATNKETNAMNISLSETEKYQMM